jgi:hypothetical protein
VCIRIPRSRATVKALHRHLPRAARRAARRLGQRVPGLLALLVPQGPTAVLRERWGLSPSWRSAGQTACLRPLGFALPKVRLVSAHLDTVKRLAWQRHAWPRLVRPAQDRKALRRCEEAARFAQGARGAARGPDAAKQLAGPTRRRRKGDTMVGALPQGSQQPR